MSDNITEPSSTLHNTDSGTHTLNNGDCHTENEEKAEEIVEEIVENGKLGQKFGFRWYLRCNVIQLLRLFCKIVKTSCWIDDWSLSSGVTEEIIEEVKENSNSDSGVFISSEENGEEKEVGEADNKLQNEVIEDTDNADKVKNPFPNMDL